MLRRCHSSKSSFLAPLRRRKRSDMGVYDSKVKEFIAVLHSDHMTMYRLIQHFASLALFNSCFCRQDEVLVLRTGRSRNGKLVTPSPKSTRFWRRLPYLCLFTNNTCSLSGYTCTRHLNLPRFGGSPAQTVISNTAMWKKSALVSCWKGFQRVEHTFQRENHSVPSCQRFMQHHVNG